MPDTIVQATVPVSPETAFDLYVNQMDTWWPRQGVFPYSFAPQHTRPGHIRFEARPDGRYYETFADGTEYTIGHVTAWNPPHALTYTWRDPNWPGSTEITVSFRATHAGTEVTCEQRGFAAAGVPELIPYYQIGNRQTMAAYFAHCRAIHELQDLEQSAG